MCTILAMLHFVLIQYRLSVTLVLQGYFTWSHLPSCGTTIWLDTIRATSHVSTHCQFECLFNSLSRLTIKKTTSLWITGPLDSGFPHKGPAISWHHAFQRLQASVWSFGGRESRGRTCQERETTWATEARCWCWGRCGDDQRYWVGN